MDKYVYTYSDDELQRRLAELKKKNVAWKDPVQRYKGLGEMDADQLAETTMDPRHRTLRRITVDDADDAARVFELLMGSDVAPRKEFIVQGAYEVDVETPGRLTGSASESLETGDHAAPDGRRGDRAPLHARPCRSSLAASTGGRRRRRAVRVYDAVFGDQPDLATWRAEVWDRHAARAGFRLVLAREDGRLVGFAYGYTGERGQWWTDRAAEALPPESPPPGSAVTSSW